VLTLAAASGSSNLTAVAGVMAFGFLVGVAGHIYHSRAMIATGILIVAIASVYVVYVPGS
jgi:hypothetical protein